MQLPSARGALSHYLIARLRRPPATLLDVPAPSGEEDFHLSLFVCSQLHQLGFDDVDERWEWSPSVVALRAALESRFEHELLFAVPRPQPQGRMRDELERIIEEDDAPSLAGYLEREGTPEQFREFVIHRSIYHLQEADPHTWGIPRLSGRAKAAMVMIQADEYGGGIEPRMHSSLFAQTMRALDLDTTPGAYLDLVPAATLATVNLMMLFGLNRRWRGALVGHLAAFEMTSTTPNLRYGNALRRFGCAPDATEFYDEHVTADEVHARIAADDLAGAFAEDEPGKAADVLFGARALVWVEARATNHLLRAWRGGRSSLREGALSVAL